MRRDLRRLEELRTSPTDPLFHAPGCLVDGADKLAYLAGGSDSARQHVREPGYYLQVIGEIVEQAPDIALWYRPRLALVAW